MGKTNVLADDYGRFIEDLHQLSGIDLSLYKEAQMKRRLSSLKDKYKSGSFKEYFEKVKLDKTMMEECLDRITINVSEFFRNKKRWAILDDQILPDLLENRRGKPLKVWSAACSTGEEPYSLSILISRHLPLNDFDILATDLDRKVLRHAEIGRFPERSLKEITGKDRMEFFEKEDNAWKIQSPFQTPIRFRCHNLLADNYEKGFDLIVCRNVVIYFTEKAKKTLYLNLSRALKTGGILFVGGTEQIFHPENYGLRPLETFFYKKTAEIT